MLLLESFEQAGDTCYRVPLAVCGEEPREGRKGGGRPVGQGFLALTAQCDSLRGKTKQCSRTGAEFPGPGDSKVEEKRGLGATGEKAVTYVLWVSRGCGHPLKGLGDRQKNTLEAGGQSAQACWWFG